MVTIYVITYNEEVMIEFFINHYRKRFPNCKIVVYDNYSTDKTVEIAKRNRCEIVMYDTNNKLSDSKYLEIKNNCWKDAITDWVIVCDCDELLDISIRDLIINRSKFNIVKAEGFSIMNEEVPFDLSKLCYGFRDIGYDKCVLFNKKQIKDINFSAGSHICNPIANDGFQLRYSNNEYKLFHYKYLSPSYTIERNELFASRLSDENKKNGWGVQYSQTSNDVIKNYESARANLQKVINVSGNVNAIKSDYSNKDLIAHNYASIDGWFNMEAQYLELLNSILPNGIFVELGAWKGKSTSFIVTEIVNRKKNIKFYTVDTFKGETNGSDENENQAYKSIDLSRIYDTYCENTKHLKEYYKTIVSNSSEAANNFKDNSIDVIFIDAGHSYEAVIGDIKAWFPKMKKNSIMAGHDYGSYLGVNKAVDEFFGAPDKVENNCWFKYIK